MISVNEAIQIIRDNTHQLKTERVDLTAALDRFLAEDIIADSDLPPFDRSQMDGYAVRAADTTTAPVSLRIVGESAAGSGWHNEMRSGEAVRIMTGAPVPSGADSVQQVELTTESPDHKTVEIRETVATGRSIVTRGSEIKAGEKVLHVGDRINAGMVAVLASFGYAKVKVGRLPRVAILATGSELVNVDAKPGRDQIRDSNNYSLAAYAKLAGALVERLPLTHDNTEDLKQTIASAAENADVVITSGGVSMGEYDFTKTALRDLDAEIFFERVSLRPGKPTVFARLPSGTLVFGLPGNPVSVSVTFNLFVRTALLVMQGANEPTLKTQWAILAGATKGSLDRESYLPAQLENDEQGRILATSLRWGGSSDFVAFSHATALTVIPAGAGVVAAGELVKVIRLP